MKIERLHLLDLDICLHDETVEDACIELCTGLLVQFSVLIAEGPASGWPVVRFTGPRGQLEELWNRYNGVPGAFKAAPWNPETVVESIDPEMRRTLAGN